MPKRIKPNGSIRMSQPRGKMGRFGNILYGHIPPRPPRKYYELGEFNSGDFIKVTLSKFISASTKIFMALGVRAKTVHLQNETELQNKTVYLSKDELSAFVIAPDGDIQSVMSSVKGRGDVIIETAITEGGDRLDCYAVPYRDGFFLPDRYAKHGFVEVARVQINPQFDDTEGEAEYISVMALLNNNEKIPVLEFGPDGYYSALEYRDQLLDGE